MMKSHHFFTLPTYSTKLLQPLTTVIDRANQCAAQADKIKESVHGNQFSGDMAIRRELEQAKVIADTVCFEQKKLCELIANPLILARWGLSLVYSGMPMPYIALVECNGMHDGFIRVNNTLVGDLRMSSRRASPASGLLLTDQTDRQFVRIDALSQGTGWDSWKQERYLVALVKMLQYEMEADSIIQFAWLFERSSIGLPLVSGNAELPVVFHDNSAVLSVFRSLAYLKGVGSGQMRDHIQSSAFQGALKFLIDVDQLLPEVSTVQTVSRQFLSKLWQRVFDHLLNPLMDSLYRRVSTELLPRSLSSILTPLARQRLRENQAVHLDSLRRSLYRFDLRPYQAQAQHLIEEMREMLLQDRQQKSLPVTRSIDTADMLSDKAVRQLYAWRNEIKNFANLISRETVLHSIYEESDRPVPTCPTPYPGSSDIGGRQMAACFILLLIDYINTQSVTLAKLGIKPPYSRKEEHFQKASEQIFAIVVTMTDRKWALIKLIHQVPALSPYCDAYLGYWEDKLSWQGCGIDSVSDLLFPAFFYNHEILENLLKNESEDFIHGFRNIREISDRLIKYIDAKPHQMMDIRLDVINPIYDELEKMNLIVVDNPANHIDANPFKLGKNTTDPWNQTSSIKTTDLYEVQESLCPIELREAPPGDGARYRSFRQKLAPAIATLCRLDVRPEAVRPRALHASARGYAFDAHRLHLAPLGSDARLLKSVEYRHRLVRGRKWRVAVLFDFSGSMNKQRVTLGKEAAVILGEGLMRNFELDVYLYKDEGPVYQLLAIYQSNKRTVMGDDALSSLFAQGTDSGSNTNRDAASLLALKRRLEESDCHCGSIIHITDAEFCASLNGQYPDANAEVEYAVRKLHLGGFKYILVDVLKSKSPFSQELPHEYVSMAGSYDSMVLAQRLGAILLAQANASMH